MSEHRIHAGALTEPIAASLAAIPEPIRERLEHVRFVVGADPNFIGLHGYRDTASGRPYKDTAHFCAPYHLADPHGPPTVVLPAAHPPLVVTHELGHALDHELGYQIPEPAPVSSYAETDRGEAVAEAFAAWLHPANYPRAAEILAADPILPIFEELAR